MYDINQIFLDLMSIIERFLITLWNTLMQLFKNIGMMPFLRKHPKALVWTIILSMFLFPPVGLIIAGMGIVAVSKEVKAEHDFIISPDIEDDIHSIVPPPEDRDEST